MATEGKCALPILRYYITFIHYFGFSINPDDDTSASYAMSRVKQATLPLKFIANAHSIWSQVGSSFTNSRDDDTFDVLECQQRRRRRHDDQDIQQVAGGASKSNRCDETSRNGVALKSIFIGVFLNGIKFLAISLTTFLALNHGIVLADYTYQGSKVFMELMLEVRLVATKFSAMIFVLSWHFNRDQVRQIIKLVKSTSVYILSSEQQQQQAAEQDTSDPLGDGQQAAQLEKSGATCRGERERLRANAITRLDKRVLGWWIMCVFVPILHFSLSETELTTAVHLWQWLDDYSLHQLSNETISYPTLMLMASFDNYIYTIHVYGTRLIGASIICIVCTLQRENITSLRWQTLKLIRVSPRLSSGGITTAASCFRRVPSPQHQPPAPHRPSMEGKWWALEGGCGWRVDADEVADKWRRSAKTESSSSSASSSTSPDSDTTDRDDNDADCSRWRHLDRPWSGASRWLARSATDCERHFVLGESDWLRVQELASKAPPAGYLSSSLHSCKRKLANLRLALCNTLIRAINACCCFSSSRSCWRLFGQQLERALARKNTANKSKSNKQNGVNDNGDNGISNHIHKNKSEQSSCATTNSTAQTAAAAATTSDNDDTKTGEPASARTTPTQQPPYLVGELGRAALSSCMMDDSLAVRRASRGCLESGGGARPTPNRHEEPLAPATMERPTGDGDDVGGSYSQRRRDDRQFADPLGEMPPAQLAIGCDAATPGGESIERHLELLANKYELVRTVNARINSCFGPTLLIQYSFLFLMSCIDVVYFSSCFNPNTKTKYIIISGMVLLWWPYLLMYKFASDIEAESKDLLISVRRLARLSFVEHQQSVLLSTTRCNKWRRNNITINTNTDSRSCKRASGNRSLDHVQQLHNAKQQQQQTKQINKLAYSSDNNGHRSPLATRPTFGTSLFDDDGNLYSYRHRYNRFAPSAGWRPSVWCTDDRWPASRQLPPVGRGLLPPASLLIGARLPPLSFNQHLDHHQNNNHLVYGPTDETLASSEAAVAASRASILNKLDHVFQPTDLSIMGMMTMDKFFLLNFAKIVITASVMIIQFIS